MSRRLVFTSTTSPTLLKAFEQLLARGHSLVVIEHQSPECQSALPIGSSTLARKRRCGVRSFASAHPEQVAKSARSHTGKVLREL